jgi:hypothetical protein
VGPAKFEVVLVNKIVDPLHTFITPEFAAGIVEKDV